MTKKKNSSTYQPSINSKDVAKLANVSQSTVSLVLSGKSKGRVSEATRLRVLAVVEDLNYQPNVSAQMLRNGSSTNIAFVVPDLQQPYFGKVIYAAEIAAAKSGYSVILLDSIANDEWCDKLISLFQSKVISSCIIYACSDEFTLKLASYRKQIVYIEPDNEDNIDIELNITETTNKIIEYIQQSDRYRIGYFRAEFPRRHFLRRHRIFESKFNALEHQNKTLHLEYSTFSVEEATYRAEILLQTQPNLVICDDDLLAGAIYRAARKHNIEIPQDIAVIGFNDTDLCHYLYPELSTVQIPAEYIGALAIKMLIDRANDIQVTEQKELIELIYVPRNSTR